jgi:hypothetical protein
MPDGAVLLDPEQEIYFGLSPVGAQIWQLLPPAHSDLRDICDALRQRYPEVDSHVLESDLRAFLGALTAQGLVLGTDERAA